MNGIDFASAQQKISEITKIVATVPDGLKEKAFELLFELAFRDAKPVEHPEGRGQSAEPAAEQRTDSAAATAATAYKLPGGVLGFLRRYTVQQEALEKLFMLEQQPILPVYKIDNSVMAKGQLQKVMMILLENALLNNQFKASYKEVRDTCKEEGFYDGNFTQTLRKNSGLFKVGAISKDKIDEEGTVELSSEGFERLATTIKEVSQVG